MVEASPLSGKLVLHLCRESVFIFELYLVDGMLCRGSGIYNSDAHHLSTAHHKEVEL